MSSVKLIEPYLFFNGRCEEAIEYYRKHLGAEPGVVLRFKDSPEPHQPGTLPAGSEEKVMHATLRVAGTTLMMSDGRCQGTTNFEGFCLSLTITTEDEAERIFHSLADGGKIEMPLSKTFWSPKFGMVEDRFGMGWMIMLPPAES
jgi:PhnB protein